MAKLGDFLGTVLADISQARLRADVEAIRIAEAYVNHDLMKHMPVPRFRMPEISLDFPVIVSEEPAGELPEKIFDEPEKSELTAIVRRSLVEARIPLEYSVRRKIYSTIHSKSRKTFLVGAQALLNSEKIIRDLSQSTETKLREIITESGVEDANVNKFKESVKSELKTLLLKKLKESPRLAVKVVSSEIKEFGDSEKLVNVRLSISEDAFEIVSEDDGGEGTIKLVPE